MQVVERCLKKEPAQRFPSGSEITSTLETILAVAPRKAGRLAAALIAISVIGSGVAAVTWSTLSKTAGWGRAAAAGGPPVTRQITFEGHAIYPFYSPDGSLIAYRTFVEGHQTTRIIAAEGGSARSVEEPAVGFYLTGWNLAGDAVLGVRWVEERAETWEIPIAGRPGKKILEEGAHACFHPDGRTLAYTGPAAPRAPFMREVRVRDLVTGEERTAAPPGDQPKDCQNPKWSPDGSLLAFWCFDPAGGGNSLHVEDVDLTDDRIVEMKGFVPGGGYFSWGPDGKSVFVEGVESGERSIWRVAVDRSEEKPEQLVRTQDALQSFTVHPSGHKLVYAGTTSATEIAVGDLSMPDVGWTYRSSPLTNSLVFG
ncbi:MAG TPA: hypothetical protein VFG76_09470, partial [Candidatus Polarisedimenticolia bacterium]|nr:hypothetical protein [Candidatus Polarisedimenticolia bacterium]